jgi:hypothetical protein
MRSTSAILESSFPIVDLAGAMQPPAQTAHPITAGKAKNRRDPAIEA